ncbi:hypothetical protein C9374_000474 [Naegleria lovaniensis]|uniref:Tr-type G domain-containing protein n=1 Tax=Naegleria lovaniensis TaxID=51637 RepID=A0AA88GSY6_NAELO|nr:uncharacterized protein C9374_000474 [Naegleria lovaniensis]KAG2388310.1 hypothetical protein C9374_000474 [Naegleria lovaniensis]
MFENPITLVMLGPTMSGKTEAVKIIRYYNSQIMFRTSSSAIKKESECVVRYDQWSGQSYRDKELYYSRLRESYQEPTMHMDYLNFVYLPPNGEKVVQIVDIGGHEKLMKNASSGISLSENSAALIVVSVDSINFQGNQKTLHDHLMFARVNGIKQVAVCVNMMDTKDFCEEEFCQVTERILKPALKNILGIKNLSEVPMIPTSLVLEENVMKNSDKMPWYKGEPLLSVVDSLTTPSCQQWKKYAPLRLSVIDSYRISGIGTVLIGQLHTGILQPDTMVKVPTLKGTSQDLLVKYIEIDHKTVPNAFPGSVIGIHVSQLPVSSCRRGLVLSDPKNHPAAFTLFFEAKIKILDCPNIIKEGFTPMVDCGLAHVACRFEKLMYTIDATTRRVASYHPSFLNKNDLAVVRLRPIKKRFLLERYNDFPCLGRITVRDNNKIVAIGTVTRIVREGDDHNLPTLYNFSKYGNYVMGTSTSSLRDISITCQH